MTAPVRPRGRGRHADRGTTAGRGAIAERRRRRFGLKLVALLLMLTLFLAALLAGVVRSVV